MDQNYYFYDESSPAPAPAPAPSPIQQQQQQQLASILHSNSNSFPIIGIAIVGIIATALLLIGYYMFVIKSYFNCGRIINSRRRRNLDDPSLMIYSSSQVINRGLKESVIRSIPVFRYKKGSVDFQESNLCECAVCLNEFQDGEELKIIPNCNHVFHIDCIDIWLQYNPNCPLCRIIISSSRIRFNPRNLHLAANDVIIELQEQVTLDFPRKLDRRATKKERKIQHALSMGDECIHLRRAKDDDQLFSIEPIRRSFSMDSSNDRKLCLSIREIQTQNLHIQQVISPVESCSGRRIRRSFFSFGSKNALLPTHLDP